MPLAQVELNYTQGVPSGFQLVFLHSDHLNTPRLASTHQGIVWSWISDAYGAALPNEDVAGSGTATHIPLRFPGQIYDAQTQLSYNYYRDYDANLGRYVQSDPIGLGGGMNTYAYVRGNPISRPDPLGLFDDGSHYYSIWVPLCAFCSQTDAFNAMRSFSAPGAPYAVDGTHDLVLTGGNPIRQTVDSCHKTITNQTLPGHMFGGQVVITITGNNGAVGAQVVGSGVGPETTLNQILGPVIFTGLGFGASQTLNPQPTF